MSESTKKILEIVSASKELAAKVGGMSKEDIIALAKERGIELTEADFAQTCELADDELDTVVGGGGEYSDGSVRCICIIGGDGNW